MSCRRYFRTVSTRLISAFFILSIFALVACGGEGSEEDGPVKTSTLQTIEAREATNAGSNSHDAPTPIPPLDMESAKKQLWVFLSKCITLDTSDIEAVQVEGNWYIRGRLNSGHETGLWEIGNLDQVIKPYDKRAMDWKETVGGDCSPEKMQLLTTPIPPTPVVPRGDDAAAAVWGLLVRCVSELAKQDVNAQDNPLGSEWIVTTDEVFVDALGRESHFGVWSVSYTGAVGQKDGLAEEWARYIAPTMQGQGCAVQSVENIRSLLPALPTPTPLPTPTAAPTPRPTPTMRPAPTPTPKIRSASDAQNSVWAHLVPCFSDITLSEFTATYDSSNSVWVVVQVSGAVTSTWSVGSNGAISASNSAANSSEATVNAGTC